jgi:tRNA modification GTPase
MRTIFAQGSRPGRAALSLFRISGPKAFASLKQLGIEYVPCHAQSKLAKIYTIDKQLIDKAVITCYFNPKSFTGEDLVEICTHGSIVIANTLTESLLKCDDVRLAEPGEFSKRAFLNGKINLTEAEAILDLINAQTAMQHRQALRQAEGSLHKMCINWRADHIKILGLLEANIDFPEEDIPTSVLAEAEALSNALLKQISESVNDYNKGKKLQEGIQVGIFGKPNTGKSSLINILAKKDVAIVTDQKGTTTDLIEIQVDIGGFLVTIIDTAGIRQTPKNQIEKIGIGKSIDLLEKCDIKIFLFDIFSSHEDLLEFNDNICQNTIFVINKSDLFDNKSKESLDLGQFKDNAKIMISCKLNHGIDKLIDILIKQFNQIALPFEGANISNIRQKTHLTACLDHINNFHQENDIILKAEEIRLSLNNLDMLTGKGSKDDILGEIFANFCIGK